MIGLSILPASAMEAHFKDHAVHTISYAPQPLPWKRIPAHSILLKELRSGRILFEHEGGETFVAGQSDQDYVGVDHS